MTTDPNRALGLQCLQRCQHIEPKCQCCPDNNVPDAVVSKRCLRAAIVCGLITLVVLMSLI